MNSDSAYAHNPYLLMRSRYFPLVRLPPPPVGTKSRRAAYVRTRSLSRSVSLACIPRPMPIMTMDDVYVGGTYQPGLDRSACQPRLRRNLSQTQLSHVIFDSQTNANEMGKNSPMDPAPVNPYYRRRYLLDLDLRDKPMEELDNLPRRRTILDSSSGRALDCDAKDPGFNPFSSAARNLCNDIDALWPDRFKIQQLRRDASFERVDKPITRSTDRLQNRPVLPIEHFHHSQKRQPLESIDDPFDIRHHYRWYDDASVGFCQDPRCGTVGKSNFSRHTFSRPHVPKYYGPRMATCERRLRLQDRDYIPPPWQSYMTADAYKAREAAKGVHLARYDQITWPVSEKFFDVPKFSRYSMGRAKIRHPLEYRTSKYRTGSYRMADLQWMYEYLALRGLEDL